MFTDGLLLNVEDKLHLTRPELKLLSLVARGLDDGEIASIVGKTEQEVAASVEGLLVKTGVRNRVALALFGVARFTLRSDG